MTSTMRIIPRLDIKGKNVVKGIHLEGLRVVGQPSELAEKYYREGADEIIYMDIVASLYGRSIDFDLLKSVAGKIFIPLTVGGGIRTMRDVDSCLRAGADKVAINTSAIKNPSILREAAERFGAQCIVLSVEAKQRGHSWEAYTEGGREHSTLDALGWIKTALTMGIGEILLTSIDREGTRRGYDISLVRAVTEIAEVPVIASGGAGNAGSILDMHNAAAPEGTAISSMLHYQYTTIGEIKHSLAAAGLVVRPT